MLVNKSTPRKPDSAQPTQEPKRRKIEPLILESCLVQIIYRPKEHDWTNNPDHLPCIEDAWDVVINGVTRWTLPGKFTEYDIKLIRESIQASLRAQLKENNRSIKIWYSDTILEA